MNNGNLGGTYCFYLRPVVLSRLGFTSKENLTMTRETWEIWADEYQDYYESEDWEGQDDLDAYKEEEQKVIDEVIRRLNQ